MDPITITDAAAAKIRSIFETNKAAQGKSLRIAVVGGGCNGFEYKFGFDDARDNDTVVVVDAVTVVIDPHSLEFLRGSEIDYVESLEGSGFKVNNPNATGTCGCGESFTTD